MATIAAPLDPLAAHTWTGLGTDAVAEDEAGEAVSACFRIELDGTLRLLALEQTAATQPASRN